MAGGRKRARDQGQGQIEEEPQPAGQQKGAAEPQGANAERREQMGARQAQMAQIARKRAAHFARFDEEDGGGLAAEEDVHVGGQEARTLGPWSSAVELVNQREQVRKGWLA